MSFFENLIKWIAPLLKPEVEAGMAALVAAKSTIVGEVNALVAKDASSVATVVTSKLNFGGFFGSALLSLASGWVASEISNLTGSFESKDGAWFDELIAKLATLEKAAGL